MGNKTLLGKLDISLKYGRYFGGLNLSSRVKSKGGFESNSINVKNLAAVLYDQLHRKNHFRIVKKTAPKNT